jgi:hypothetical protein
VPLCSAFLLSRNPIQLTVTLMEPKSSSILTLDANRSGGRFFGRPLADHGEVVPVYELEERLEREKDSRQHSVRVLARLG